MGLDDNCQSCFDTEINLKYHELVQSMSLEKKPGRKPKGSEVFKHQLMTFTFVCNVSLRFGGIYPACSPLGHITYCSSKRRMVTETHLIIFLMNEDVISSKTPWFCPMMRWLTRRSQSLSSSLLLLVFYTTM